MSIAQNSSSDVNWQTEVLHDTVIANVYHNYWDKEIGGLLQSVTLRLRKMSHGNCHRYIKSIFSEIFAEISAKLAELSGN